MMGRKLDLSGLSDNEAEHVLQVVQRDMRLRKKEEERLSELKQELDEEGSRCLLLSRQSCFNQRCCIRCCSPFIFLLNPKRQCRDCRYNVCKACRVYNKREKAWLCSACQKSRLLKTQSLEWFYMNVKKRFKRFGSAKVLKTLYRKHLAEHSALSELTEGSACDESICNEGSVCGSDSTFYRQTEEHSMAETLAVAMRVAEEAIDEAISKAECDTASQEKQNEALYLREHRGELIEELANTIVQKIIKRRKTLAEIRAECDDDWARERNTEFQHHHRTTCDQASGSLKRQPNLWRSHSAFSLLDNDPPSLIQESPRALKKEAVGSPLAAWKSVDRLDNAGVSSVLKSPDGNWIALQSAQLSRPSLLTRRKSLVYSALERESGVVSAYEGLGSDNESKQEADSSWGAVLQKIHRKMTDSNFNLHDSTDSIPQLRTSRRGSRDDLVLDLGANWKLSKPLLKRRVPVEIRKPSSSVRPSIIDVNFNLEEAGGEGREVKAGVEKVRRSRKKRRSKKEPAGSSSASDLKNTDNHTPHPCEAVTSDTLTSGATTPEPLNPEGDVTGRGACQVDEELAFKLQQLAGHACEASARGEDVDEEREGRRNRTKEGDEEDEREWKMEIDLDGGRTEDEEEKEMDDEEMKNRLYRLVAQSRLTYFSSTDDELDRAGQSDADWDRDEDAEVEDKDLEKREGLSYKLCRLENQVRASQFSSTEDELDRVGVEKKEGEEEEELAVKVCRLASQVNADQFSSTEDEIDRAGRGEEGEETAEEETLWKLQAKKAVQAAQLRDLASLVSASQFSSTEDELDRFGEQEVNEGGVKRTSTEMWEGAAGRRGSVGDIDEEMFDLREERKEVTVTSKNVLESQTKAEAVGRDETEAEERVTEADMTTKGHLCDEKVEVSAVEAERTEEIITEARLQRETQRPEAKWREERFQKEEKWETAAGSDVEDVEFDKIISSMLLMTLEDMQVEAMNNKSGTNRESEQEETKENDKTEGGSRLRENEADAQSTEDAREDSIETQTRSDERPESGGCVSEKIVGNIYDKQESGDVTGRRKNVQEERQMSSVEERPTDGTTKETPETNGVTSTCKRTEVCDEKQDGRGGMAAETERDTADCGRSEETKEGNTDDMEQSSSSSLHEGLLSPEEIQNDSDMELVEFISTLLEQRYSAISLRSITTEVLKVLNATEELLQGMEGGDNTQLSTPVLPPNTDPMKLDQQFCRLEENVYVAAGSVYSLEAELNDLEECARGICSSTSDLELSFLEEQVAAAAAKVQQSELQISDISARINALKNAGLNVDPQSCFTKSRIPVMPVTLDSSRQMRRRLPAPPVKGCGQRLYDGRPYHFEPEYTDEELVEKRMRRQREEQLAKEQQTAARS